MQRVAGGVPDERCHAAAARAHRAVRARTGRACRGCVSCSVQRAWSRPCPPRAPPTGPAWLERAVLPGVRGFAAASIDPSPSRGADPATGWSRRLRGGRGQRRCRPAGGRGSAGGNRRRSRAGARPGERAGIHEDRELLGSEEQPQGHQHQPYRAAAKGFLILQRCVGRAGVSPPDEGVRNFLRGHSEGQPCVRPTLVPSHYGVTQDLSDRRRVPL